MSAPEMLEVLFLYSVKLQDNYQEKCVGLLPFQGLNWIFFCFLKYNNGEIKRDKQSKTKQQQQKAFMIKKEQEEA